MSAARFVKPFGICGSALAISPPWSATNRAHFRCNSVGFSRNKRSHFSPSTFRCISTTMHRLASVGCKCPIAAIAFGHQQEYRATRPGELHAPAPACVSPPIPSPSGAAS
jgi:hypothetical protein